MSHQEGSGSGGFVGAFLYDADVGRLSTALVIATIEFVGCAGILLALSVVGAISPEAVILWGATILVPLSLTIGYLGVGVGMTGRRAAIRGPADRAGAPRIVLS